MVSELFTVVTYEAPKSLGFASGAGLVRRATSITQEVLVASLTAFTQKMESVLAALPAQGPAGRLRLREISVALEVSAEGGVSFVAGVTAGATASLTLTFAVPE